MGLIQASRYCCNDTPSGSSIAGFAVDQLEQTTNFISGAVQITLSHTPFSEESIVVDYSGDRLLGSVAWSYAAGIVTILFADSYVTTYDEPPWFQVTYPYTDGSPVTITGYKADQFEQVSNFISGGVILTLTETPISADSIVIDYSGDRLLSNVAWSYAAGQVTILFADPYVTTYDSPPFFQCTYPY